MIAQIELYTKRDEYEQRVYVLPKQLDEKVARLHLDALGVRLTELTRRAGGLHRRACRGPVQAAITTATSPMPPGRHSALRIWSPQVTNGSPGLTADAGAARDQRALRCRAAARRPADRGLPARHRRDREPGARAARRQVRELALCAANPLSTQDDVAAALGASLGVEVHAERGEDRAAYARNLETLVAGAPGVLVDDGAELIVTAHAAGAAQALIGATEETTTGLVRLRAMAAEGELLCPVLAVNEMLTERLFNDRYGTGQSALDGILRATNLLFAGRSVVVLGYGSAGRGVAQRAKGAGAVVIVCEVDPVRALEARMEGYRSDGFARGGRARRGLHRRHRAPQTCCGASISSGWATARCSRTPATSTSRSASTTCSRSLWPRRAPCCPWSTSTSSPTDGDCTWWPRGASSTSLLPPVIRRP